MPEVKKTPYPPGYIPASVQLRDPNAPVGVTVEPGMTTLDFALDDYATQRGGMRPVTQREIGADALQRAKMGIPEAPTDLSPGLLDFMRREMPEMPAPIKQKPAESYGTNRGGTGSAGRKTTEAQLGKSQFDVGPQFMEPEVDGYQPLEMPYPFADKPWELDDNTNADVAPGTKITPEPDLTTTRGLYDALSKRYPDILTKNLDELQKGRVTMADVDAQRDRAGLGSLFIAASKAASGAGSVGGQTAESIAEKIVTREDNLARQQLKDRLDVANENMQMNARAVDLAMKQINFADEREQYDPNSDVSQFARDFMKQEFDVNVPADVPAYQLKQFMPAVVQKYQAEERARYQAALLGYRETPEQQAIRRATEAKAERDFKAEQAKLNRQTQKDIADLRAKKVGAQKAAPQTPKEKLQGQLVQKDAEKYVNRLQAIDKLDGALQSWSAAANEEQKVQIGQTILKMLNDPENSDAVGAEEVKRLADELQPYSTWSAKGRPRIGRDLPAFRQKVELLRQRLLNSAGSQYERINQQSPGLVNPPKGATKTGGDTLPSGKKRLTPEERQKLEDYKRRQAGGQ